MMYLFIGGNIDGQRLCISDARHTVYLPTRDQDTSSVYATEKSFAPSVTKAVEYTKRYFQVGANTEMCCFVDSELSSAAAFILLMDRYKPL